MQKSIRLIVIDDNIDVTSSIKKYFEGNDVIKVVACIKDGVDGLDFIVNHQEEFDLIVLDVLIPKMDGLTILENIKNRKVDKKVIVLTSFKEEFMLKQLMKYNIDHLMLKPFSLESLEMCINELFKPSNIINTNASGSIELKVSEILHNLGVPSHIRGYQYIREGILMIYHDENSITHITKEIYPKIANKYDTTSTRVERAIRHAIEISWDRGDLDLMEEIFGHSVQFERAKPTNSEFINTIADRIKLNNKLLVS